MDDARLDNIRPPVDQLRDKLRDRVEVVHTPNGICWEWQATGRRRYGKTFYRDPTTGRRVDIDAHRAAWLVERGPIPTGMIVMHRCDNPRCVNPDHLRLGYQRDNMRDMHHKGRAGGGGRGPDRVGGSRPMFTAAELAQIAARKRLAREQPSGIAA